VAEVCADFQVRDGSWAQGGKMDISKWVGFILKGETSAQDCTQIRTEPSGSLANSTVPKRPASSGTLKIHQKAEGTRAQDKVRGSRSPSIPLSVITRFWYLAVRCYTVQCCTVMFRIVLYCIVMCCIVTHCIVESTELLCCSLLGHCLGILSSGPLFL